MMENNMSYEGFKEYFWEQLKKGYTRNCKRIARRRNATEEDCVVEQCGNSESLEK